MVGINNRDLRDMSIDLNRTRQLAARLGPDVTVISESGIHTYAEVRELSHFANGFLIGSALMEQADLEAAVKRVLLGENKVCGLTRPQDAQWPRESGAIYGGLIFVPTSPRAVNDARGQSGDRRCAAAVRRRVSQCAAGRGGRPRAGSGAGRRAAAR